MTTTAVLFLPSSSPSPGHPRHFIATGFFCSQTGFPTTVHCLLCKESPVCNTRVVGSPRSLVQRSFALLWNLASVCSSLPRNIHFESAKFPFHLNIFEGSRDRLEI